MVGCMSERLTKAGWIAHGLATLARDGAHALKVGPMATALNVSRGSFYWHFDDIGAFRAELLAAWREQATQRVIDAISRRSGPGRLNHLLRGAFSQDRALDRAFRAWAADDADVAAVVTSADADRFAYITRLLTDAGVAPDKAPARAAFLYWAYLGQASVMDPRHASIAESAIDDIAELFER